MLRSKPSAALVIQNSRIIVPNDLDIDRWRRALDFYDVCILPPVAPASTILREKGSIA